MHRYDLTVCKWPTNNETFITAGNEFGSLLFLRSLWLLGSKLFLWGGSEGDGQVAGILRRSSRTRQSCVGGSLEAELSLLRGDFPGHDVDHGSLVALHAGTKLKEQSGFFYIGGHYDTIVMQSRRWLTVKTKHSHVPKNVALSVSYLCLSAISDEIKAPKTYENRKQLKSRQNMSSPYCVHAQ